MARSTRISICRCALRDDEAQNDFLWKDRVISRKEWAFLLRNDSCTLHATPLAIFMFILMLQAPFDILVAFEEGDCIKITSFKKVSRSTKRVMPFVETSPLRPAKAYFHAEGLAPCPRFSLVFVSLLANFLLKNYRCVTGVKIRYVEEISNLRQEWLR